MEKITKFLNEVNKLKTTKRSELLSLEIENPETIAQHSFRSALLAWVLADGIYPSFNIEALIKIILAHRLPAVYVGEKEKTKPIKDDKKIKESLREWRRVSNWRKKLHSWVKFQKEKAAIRRVIHSLYPKIQDDVYNRWLDYKKLNVREARFAKQTDKIENLLQALEYWGPDSSSPVTGRWDEIKDLVDNPLLLDFLAEIEDRFYESNKGGNEELSKKLKFIIDTGKLKKMVRTGWKIRGVENGSTVAEDSFVLAVMVWALTEKKSGLNLERMLKMALVFELCEVNLEDKTPYEGILPNNEKEQKEALKEWPRFDETKKRERFKKDYDEERKCLIKLVDGLPQKLEKEIILLWNDCKKRITKEGDFVNQIYWLNMMFQALYYWEKDKSFPIKGWVDQMSEYIDDPKALELLDAFYKRFFGKNFSI